MIPHEPIFLIAPVRTAIGKFGGGPASLLLHDLAHRGGHRGIATLCVSGGMGLAALVETVERPEVGAS